MKADKHLILGEYECKWFAGKSYPKSLKKRILIAKRNIKNIPFVGIRDGVYLFLRSRFE